MEFSKWVEAMLEDYFETLDPPPTEDEKRHYRKLSQSVYQTPSRAAIQRVKAYQSEKDWITRTIHCPNCHTSYYYDLARGFDGHCYYCESDQNLELEDTLINQIPPWVDIKTYVWYESGETASPHDPPLKKRV
jgi:hypothetical protein